MGQDDVVFISLLEFFFPQLGLIDELGLGLFSYHKNLITMD